MPTENEKTTTEGVLSARRRRLILGYCLGCVRLDPVRLTCKALTSPFPLWGDGECWARQDDPLAYKQQLKEQLKYAKTYGGERHTVKAIEEQLEVAEDLIDDDIAKLFHEESHPQLNKPPQGEKKDGTLFGKERMKDNRYKPKWGEE